MISQDKYLSIAKEYDPQTGYYYFGARYYEPKIARWLSVDPMAEGYLNSKIGMGGVYNPFNLLFYGYAHNNPIILIDPDGKVVVMSKISKKSLEKYFENLKSGEYKSDDDAFKEASKFAYTNHPEEVKARDRGEQAKKAYENN